MICLEVGLVRVKKIVLREITRELVRDSTLNCFGKKRKKVYRSVVFDVKGRVGFLGRGQLEVRRDTASDQGMS